MLSERTKVDAVDRLNAFYADELDCHSEDLSQAGVRVIVTQRRSRPAWGGYTKPLVALARQNSLIVACTPDLAPRVRAEVKDTVDGVDSVWSQFDRLRRVCQQAVPYAFLLSGYSMYCETASFRPFDGQATLLAHDDPRGRDLRSRFDGDIFVVFGSKGEIASWAAIKLKSDDIWEIAVVTESAYRGRGLAKDVVSAATAYILENGRVPLYIHDRSNRASARVCRALGYQEYGHEFFCEY